MPAASGRSHAAAVRPRRRRRRLPGRADRRLRGVRDARLDDHRRQAVWSTCASRPARCRCAIRSPTPEPAGDARVAGARPSATRGRADPGRPRRIQGREHPYGYPAGDAVLCRPPGRWSPVCAPATWSRASAVTSSPCSHPARRQPRGRGALPSGCWRRCGRAARRGRGSLTASVGWATLPGRCPVGGRPDCRRGLLPARREADRQGPGASALDWAPGPRGIASPGRAPAARPPRLLSRRSRPRRRGLARDARRVAAGELPETLRLARPGRLSPSRSATLLASGYAEAVAAARAAGFGSSHGWPADGRRFSTKGRWSSAHAVPDPDPRPGIHERFEAEASLSPGAATASGSTPAWARCRASTAPDAGA